MHSVQGKGILITGAGRGIGKRLAIGLAGAGAHVGLIARTRQELEASKLEIDQASGRAHISVADVSDYAQMTKAFNILERKLGSVEILIAAAGIQGPIGSFVESDAAQWPATLNTNLLGVMYSIKAALPGMIERRSGKIIVITGGGAATARPRFAPYAASKAAAARLVESIAEEVRDHNVQVNCFAPGGVYTSMTDEILAAGERAGPAEQEDARKIRVTGGVPAEKQLAFVLFLGSESSNHINGKMIHVNDDLRRLEHMNMTPDLYTLRRSRT